ncbi:MAG: phage virion morphogenesis protein [Deltaproteobacteria bacterium]|nr:MAG: phage virion morphogenesis protein [Deltaproteobacteria bacterium]
MSGTLIKIEVDDREIREALSRLASKVRNLAPAMKNIGEYLQRSTWERFGAQKDPQGKPWAKLKPGTLARKKTSKILIESSGLRDSIHYEASSDSVSVGTDKIYAAIHQFGGKTSPHTIRPSRKKALFWPGASHPVGSVNHPGSQIPARPFLGVSDEDKSEILDILRDHVHSGEK